VIAYVCVSLWAQRNQKMDSDSSLPSPVSADESFSSCISLPLAVSDDAMLECGSSDSSSTLVLPGTACSSCAAARTRCGAALAGFLEKIKAAPRDAQNTLLFDMLKAMRADHPGQWVLLGQRFCRECWMKELGIGRPRLLRLVAALDEGSTQPPTDGRTGGPTRLYEQPGKQSADSYMMWLWANVAESLAEGDFHDTSELRVNPPSELQLPTPQQLLSESTLLQNSVPLTSLQQKWIKNTSKRELYEDYCQWANMRGEEPASYTTYLRTWKEWSPKVLRVRDKLQHGRCEDCAMYTEFRKKATSTQSRQEIMDAYLKHLKGIFADRTIYARAVSVSETCTSKWAGVQSESNSLLSMCIDGMDQSKFRIPRNLSSSKLWSTAWRPVAHVTGVVAHGIGEYYYLADQDMRKDSNNNSDVLAKSLDHVTRALEARGMPMPVHLRVQADNTCREQKNTNGLLFLAWLCGTGVFQTTELSTMVKGHTHIDVDQRFSAVGTLLKGTKVLQDMDDFREIIQRKLCGQKGREVIAEMVPGVRDWSDFFKAADVQLHGHTGAGSAHVFKFVKRCDLVEGGPDGMVVDPGCFGVGLTENKGDVIMLVKALMRDTSLCQQPLLILPKDVLDKLPLLGPNSAAPRNVMTQRMKAEYMKTAAAVEAEPWGLLRAGSYLRQFVKHNEDVAPQSLWALSAVFKPRASTCAEAPVAWKDFAPEGVKVISVAAKPKKRKACAKHGNSGHQQAASAEPRLVLQALQKQPEDGDEASDEAQQAGVAVPPGEAGGPAAAVQPHEEEASGHEADASEPEAGEAHRAERPVLRRPAAATAAKRARHSKFPPLPSGVSLGCPKCRRSHFGCVECRSKAGVKLSESTDGVSQWQLLRV
jgi:hypothetical protein